MSGWLWGDWFTTDLIGWKMETVLLALKSSNWRGGGGWILDIGVVGLENRRGHVGFRSESPMNRKDDKPKWRKCGQMTPFGVSVTFLECVCEVDDDGE